MLKNICLQHFSGENAAEGKKRPWRWARMFPFLRGLKIDQKNVFFEIQKTPPFFIKKTTLFLRRFLKGCNFRSAHTDVFLLDDF